MKPTLKQIFYIQLLRNGCESLFIDGYGTLSYYYITIIIYDPMQKQFIKMTTAKNYMCLYIMDVMYILRKQIINIVLRISLKGL